ncbi:hypothetical protein L1987_54372 [Smallanthus sonchifolius]|uniref:Uncharacterized protein n=1 Tax=Smallanthus sonchifolius TaxID=185202 RepID=A0ACB9E7A6_9ASTR|nr:hypothetical protein L1987_54372 [Smallanthus sonchifolius]
MVVGCSSDGDDGLEIHGCDWRRRPVRGGPVRVDPWMLGGADDGTVVEKVVVAGCGSSGVGRWKPTGTAKRHECSSDGDDGLKMHDCDWRRRPVRGGPVRVDPCMLGGADDGTAAEKVVVAGCGSSGIGRWKPTGTAKRHGNHGGGA